MALKHKGGKFHVHSISTIDDGIEILTGIRAGERNEKGFAQLRGSEKAYRAGRKSSIILRSSEWNQISR